MKRQRISDVFIYSVLFMNGSYDVRSPHALRRTCSRSTYALSNAVRMAVRPPAELPMRSLLVYMRQICMQLW